MTEATESGASETPDVPNDDNAPQAASPKSKPGTKKTFSPLSKNWCFTGWVLKGAKGPEDIWSKYGAASARPIVTYVGGKLEKTKTGQVHWQGWLQFSTRKRATGVMKILPSREYHISLCKGTEAENEVYCKKTDTQLSPFVCFGAFTTQGKPNQIAQLEAAVRAGKSKKFLWQNFFSIMTTRYRGVYEGMVQLAPNENKSDYPLHKFGWEPLKFGLQTKFDSPVSNTWVLAGEAGIGKTEFALAHFKRACLIKHTSELNLFDAAEHDGIVFDDFDAELGKMPRETQVHLCEQRRSSGIRILYQVISIPGGTKKIFTTNRLDGGILFPHTSLARRHKVRVLSAVDHKEVTKDARAPDEVVVEEADESGPVVQPADPAPVPGVRPGPPTPGWRAARRAWATSRVPDDVQCNPDFMRADGVSTHYHTGGDDDEPVFSDDDCDLNGDSADERDDRADGAMDQ